MLIIQKYEIHQCPTSAKGQGYAKNEPNKINKTNVIFKLSPECLIQGREVGIRYLFFNYIVIPILDRMAQLNYG